MTRWIGAFRAGQTADAGLLWDRYFIRLIGLARRIFSKAAVPRIVSDEEDAAVGAIATVCLGLREGRFPDLNGRHELSRFLRHLTKCRVLKQGHHERREKRGGGRVVAERDLPGSGAGPAALDQVAGPRTGPDSALLHDEESRKLLDLLKDDTLCQIALLRMEDCSIQTIAERIGRSPSLVRLKLAVIRRKWEGVTLAGGQPDEA